MRASSVFLDSGIFIAFLDQSDRYHSDARRLFEVPPRNWMTSLAVVSETYGWFLHRLGEQAARHFRLLISELPDLELLALDADHHTRVVRTLERLRGYKLTYVDASSLVFVKTRKVRTVWGTDRDLAIEGAQVTPVGDRH